MIKKIIKNTLITIFILGFCVFFFEHARNTRRVLKRIQTCSQAQVRFLRQDPIVLEGEKERKFKIKNDYLPYQLKNVMFADDAGIVTDVKKVNIEGINAPYNASIVDGNDNDYFLYFRYDIKKKKPANIHLEKEAYLAMVKLDKSFNVISDYATLNTNSKYSEDPKAFKIKDKIYLSYNDIVPIRQFSRSIRIAALEKDGVTLKHTTDYDQHIRPVEKNWMPFVLNDEPYFIYQVNPHKIIKINSLKENDVKHLVYPNNPGLVSYLWSKKWGVPSGSTPAIKVDKEMLAFFHSRFKEKWSNTTWYVFGAYTFEPYPPFRITGVSKEPILFKGIYDTKVAKHYNKSLRCIFPSGVLLRNNNGKEELVVSCGENDSGMKILIIDKNRLLESLRRVYNNPPHDERFIGLDEVKTVN